MFKISSILQGSIFSTIEDEAGQTSIKVAEIFGNMKKTISLLREDVATTSGFSYDNSFINSLNDDIIALDKYKTEILSGVQTTEEAFKLHLQGASVEAQEYANSVNVAAISTDEFKVKSKQNMISSLSQGKIWSDQKKLIDEFQTKLNNCKLTQEEYLSAIQKSNPQLAKYLSGLNGADASLKGYIGSLIAGKAATIGLQVASMALNAAISMGVSVAISGLISLVDELVVTEKELIEKGTDAANKINELSNSFKTNSKTVSDIAEKFAELAQGVDSLTGKNKSLSNDEYSEFLDLSNQLAEVFPTLSRHYDENGNAIVNLSGDVDTIVGSLQNLLNVQREIVNQDIVDNLPDAFAGTKAKSDSYKDEIKKIESAKAEYDRLIEFFDDDKKVFDFINSFNGEVLSIKVKADKYDEYISALNTLGYTYEKIGEDLTPDGEYDSFYYKVWGFDSETLQKTIKGTALHEAANQFGKDIQLLKEQNKGNWSGLSSSIASWLYTEDSYKIASDATQSLIQNVINNVDFGELNFKDWEQAENYIRDNILKVFTGVNKETISAAVSDMFSAKSLFESGEISFDSYKEAIETFKSQINAIPGISDDTKNALGSTFGINFSDATTNYDALVANVQGKLEEAFREKAGELSLKDLEIASKLDIDKGTLYSWEELIGEILKTKKALEDAEEESKTFIEKISNVGNLSEGFDALGKVYNDVKDGGSFDVGALFDKKFIENFSGLGDAYTNFMQVIGESPNDISACQGAFNELVTAFINNSDALDGLSEETKDVTVAYLEQMGVANAAEIVDRQLALQKARLSLEAEAYTNKTYEEIIAEYNAAEAGSVAQQALAELALTKLNVNNAAINTSGDIDQIIALANAANASAPSLQNLAKAKQLMAQAESYENDPYLQNSPFASERIEAYRNQAQHLLNQPLEYEEIDPSKFKAPTGGGGSGGSGSSGTSKESTSFDWIEIAIKRAESAINKLKTTASSAYKTLKTRLSATSDEIAKVNEEIELQNKAYKRYMQEANSVGLSEDLAKKVREGSIDINKYDSATSDLIKKYQDWYEKAIECSESVDELHESLGDLYSDKFDDISKDFDNQLSLIEHDAKTYENRISEHEERGYLNTKNFYQSLMELERKNLALLNEEYSSLKQTLEDAVASGEIAEFSEEWYSMKSEINDTNEAIQESTLSMLEFVNTIRELDWEIFEFLQDQISNVNSEAEFLISLMGNKKMFDKNGQITDEGFATVGLHGMAHNVYMRQADDYAKKIFEVNDELAKDPNNTILVAKKQEYLELQREAILAAEEEKQAIIDLVEEGFEVELDYLNELIEKYTDALDSAKSLHDYQKKIEGITDEISSIERQIIAYSGNDSEEGKLKLQELTKSLKESQSELEDAEYDQYISDQKALLDDLYEEYEKILNERLDDIDTLLKNVYDAINTNAATIDTTLSGIASEVGIELTKSMSSIWDVQPTQANGDVNSDGKITAADARLILRAAAGLEKLEGDAAKNADVDSDGKITAADARLALRVAAGLDELPTNRVISIYGDEFSDKLTSVNSVLDSIYKDVAFISTNIKGDLNKDGVVTEEDAEIIIKVSGQKNASDYLGYDMNNDGKVNAADARIILQMANGKISGFSSGGYIADLQRVAYNNGDDIVTVNTLKRGEAVLTPEQAAQFKSLVSNLTTLTGIVDISKMLNGIRDVGQARNNVSGNISNTFNIAIDHVEDYDDFVNQLKSDPKFEKMVQAMTLERALGKSSLTKNKYNW